MPPSSKSRFRLLVEGPDDLHTICNFLKRHGYDWNSSTQIRPYVQSIEGFESLAGVLTKLPRGSFDSLGIVVDADTDVVGRWRQIQESLSRFGIALPPQPDPGGTIVDGGGLAPRLGVWLMPDNQSAGALEHFLAKLIPSDDPCWDYADAVALEAHQRYQGRACPKKDQLKSRLHSWIAWQREPGRPFGTALTAEILAHDGPEALAFRDWFWRLFPETPAD